MKSKEIKTNAMRFLDKHKLAYDVIQYECDEFTDVLRWLTNAVCLMSNPTKHL